MADRDLDLERRLVEQAAKRARVPDVALALNTFAIERAGDGPVRDHETRDFALETREELADGRNYLAWWYQQLPDGTARYMVTVALEQVCAAYSTVLLAEDMLTAPKCNQCGEALLAIDHALIPTLRCFGCAREVPAAAMRGLE